MTRFHWAGLVVLMLAAQTSTAATIVVNPQGTGDYATPQLAINAAWDGDIVQLEPGSYGLDAPLDLLGKRITLRGGDGSNAGAVVLTPNVEGHMAIKCVNGETAATHLSCMTITGLKGLDATAPWGGILVEHASPTITDVVVSNSEVPKHGGGITLINSTSLLHNVVVSECRAATYLSDFSDLPTYGGGLYVSGGSPTLTACTLQKCEASYGGNLYATGAAITIRDSKIARSGRFGRLGGGACLDDCSAVLERVQVIKNDLVAFPDVWWGQPHTAHGGTGMAFRGGSAKLTDCVVRDNSVSTLSAAEDPYLSVFKGGGLYVKGCQIFLESCAVTGNYCGDHDLSRNSALGSLGGGIFIEGDETRPTSLVMAGGRVNLNTATGRGGGIYVHAGDSVSPDTVPKVRLHGVMMASNHAAWDWGWHWNQDVGSLAFVNTVVPFISLIADHTGDFGEWLDPADIRHLYYKQWISKGGGMYIEGADVECWNSTFFENYADQSGGGFYINQTADPVRFHGCHIVQCSATNNGPGVAMAGVGHVSFDEQSSLVGCRFQNVPRVDLSWDASQFGLFAGNDEAGCTVALQDTYVCAGYVGCPYFLNAALYDVTQPLEMLPFYHWDLECSPVGFTYEAHYDDLGGNTINMDGCDGVDSDGDGVPDALDRCPGGPDTDSDSDGVPDCKDQCPGVVDADFDQDGVLDCHDQCPGEPDVDSDGDGVMDCKDQCPGIPDTDSDGDGVADCHDQCPGTADVDSDGDGALDCVDPCPQIPYDCDGDPSTLELAPGMSIQGAIDIAPHGGTLSFASGRYDAQRVYVAGRTLHFKGAVDGHGHPTTVFHGGGEPMVQVEGGPLSAGTSFEDIVWTGGTTDWPSGLWGSAVTVTNIDNSEVRGSVSFTNCTFTNQRPISQAGLAGILRIQSNDCEIVGCTFTGNGEDGFSGG
ncbi:MAG: thrombospondin type 3 repeat-containing protein, partial [Candidatus Latescibacteria bacterium]|nr:thrombospondin type 3 repeat-containing protein [Candidatus Latescibacterota bacterium]